MNCVRFVKLGMMGMALWAVTGCMSSRQLDRQIERTVAAQRPRAAIEGSNTLTDAFAAIQDTETAPAQIDMNLTSALQLATKYSRSLQTKREQLYLSGLSLLAARRQFEPQLSGTLGYVLDRSGNTDTATSSMDVNASQSLFTGGTLSAEAQSSAVSTTGEDNSDTNAYASSAGIKLSQPLLAGAGYEASHETRTQAEKDLIYTLRAFALERQDFAIHIMELYYDLLIKQAVITNTQCNVDQSIYLRKRSEALFKIRRAPALDVMRSQQQELVAQNSLLNVKTDFEISADRFLVELGLPVNTRAVVTGTIPEVKPVSLEADVCLRLALSRRMDLMTSRDQREDADRRVRIARRALLPDVEAYGEAGVSGSSTESLSDQDTENTMEAGVILQIPFDKRNERDGLKKVRIASNAAMRNLNEKRDSISVEITEAFSRLKSLEQTAMIETKNVGLARRRAEFAVLQFKNGDFSNRDVVEAQNELLSAENSRVRALTAYELQRIRLLRNIGLMDILPDGTLVELPVPEPGVSSQAIEQPKP